MNLSLVDIVDARYRVKVLMEVSRRWPHADHQHLGEVWSAVLRTITVRQWTFEQFEDDHHLRAWVYGLARRCARLAYKSRDRWRSMRRSNASRCFTIDGLQGSSLLSFLARTGNSEPMSSEHQRSLYTAEQVRLLHGALAHLTDRQRSLLEMRVVSNISWRECARTLGGSSSALVVETARAVHRLGLVFSLIRDGKPVPHRNAAWEWRRLKERIAV